MTPTESILAFVGANPGATTQDIYAATDYSTMPCLSGRLTAMINQGLLIRSPYQHGQVFRYWLPGQEKAA